MELSRHVSARRGHSGPSIPDLNKFPAERLGRVDRTGPFAQLLLFSLTSVGLSPASATAKYKY